MIQAQPPDPVTHLVQSIDQIECEHGWYASAFKLLNPRGSAPEKNPDLTELLAQTCRALKRVIPFRHSAFYLFDDSQRVPTLKFWNPVSSERLFRNSVNTWVATTFPDGKNNGNSFRFFHDEPSGMNLILESIGLGEDCHGVFAGIFSDSSLVDPSHELLKKIPSILKNLAWVLQMTAMRSSAPSEDKISQGEGGAPVPGLQEDDSPERQEKGNYKPSSMHDLLTDLPSRALVEDRLHMALAHARYNGEKVAVLILDVDNFKRMNDFFGMHWGDRLLKSLSGRFRSCLREEDTLGRNGGDEFVILLPDIHLVQDIEYRANKIFEGIRRPMELDGKEVHASCSMGIAIYPDDGEDSASLLRAAKAALGKAKEDGKDRFQFFRPNMLSRGYVQMSLEGGLRKALDREEFRLFFQPKISLQTGKIQGMEALLRWKHPKHGLVAPSFFIPMAEELGLIQPIGEWVLLNACRQIKAWMRSGFPPIRIAVNLSGYQVNQTQWMTTLKKVFSRTGVDPRYLEVEITETVLMDNSEVALANLHEMNEMGMRISIDDFGTGYSSLSYLKRFPIHSLKIDRSFIRGIGERENGTDAVITNAIVSLARALNLRTIAEGVERAEERDYLGAIGCDEMQGFLFSRPRPVEQINYMFTRKLKNPVQSYWHAGSNVQHAVK